MINKLIFIGCETIQPEVNDNLYKVYVTISFSELGQNDGAADIIGSGG